MLELKRLSIHRRGEEPTDSGLALVAVLVVMFVGFVIVSTIAASVIFTIQANGDNKVHTQAFIAAESGRDQLLSQIVGATCTVPGSFTATSAAAGLQFSATGFTVPTAGTAAKQCPDATTSTIQIDSTGTANGATTTIHSVYAWTVQRQSPGGVMTYFSGQFKATKATYTGDLVIRPDPVTGIGNFTCNSGGGTQVNGDLWVLAGNVDLSAGCKINGSIYASGTISISSSSATVTGDLVSVGDVSVTANKAVIGNIYTDGKVTIDKSVTSVIKYEAGGAANVLDPTVVTNLAASAQKCATTIPLPGQCVSGPQSVSPNSPTKTPATSTFNPSLLQVLAMTQWMDLTATRAAWGADVYWLPTVPCDGSDVRSAAMATLPSGYNRVGVDYTGCPGNVTINVGNGQITHDAVFLVKPSVSMNVTVGTITTTVPSPYPQLIFIHGDAGAVPNHVPDCGVTPSANDGIDVASATTVRMMVYTPCGLGMANHISFNGQYYANDDGNARWVWPIFSCAAMKWGPIALGCSVKDEAAAGGGTPPPPVLSLGALISQTEQ